MGAWTFLITDYGKSSFPGFAARLPNEFWIGVIPHIFQLSVALILSLVVPRGSKDGLDNLTIWTTENGAA